jgi:hypothetical protein
MGAYLAATVYAWFSHLLGFALVRNSVGEDVATRALGLWILAAAALFFLRDPMATLLAVGSLILLLAPTSLAHRAAFFLIAVPCAPTYLSVLLPFPGIDHLTLLTHYKMAVVTLLVPLFWYQQKPSSTRILSPTPTICLILYAAYTSAIVTGVTNPTVGLRTVLDQIITFVVPFVAIRLAIRSLDDIEEFFTAFLVASVFLAAVTFVASAKQWDFYGVLQPASVFTIPDTRSGFMRVNATANTHSLGYHLAAGLIVLQYLTVRRPINWIELNIMRTLMLIGIYFTDSRGAMGGLAIAAVTYTLIAVKIRKWIFVSLLALGTVAAAVWLLTAEFEATGALGTFNYRQELLKAAIPYIMAHPVFGNYNFYADKSFAHLLQGQGIIDVTNFYLQVALHYGLIGVGLLFAALLGPLAILTNRALSVPKRAIVCHICHSRTAAESDESREWRQAAAATAGCLFGWLFLVVTTSDVGLTVHLGIVFAAMAQALSDLPRQSSQNGQTALTERSGRASSHRHLEHASRTAT